MRMLVLFSSQTRNEEHSEKVRELDAEYKNRSGESRRRTSSSSRNSGESPRLSLDSTTTEQNNFSLQFNQVKSSINCSVKDRLKKMQNPKRPAHAQDTWSKEGASRSSLGNAWNSYARFRCRCETSAFCRDPVSSCKCGDEDSSEEGKDYPDPSVLHMEEGQEHPKRAVECYACGKYEDTMSQLVIMRGDSSVHPACLSKLLAW